MRKTRWVLVRPHVPVVMATRTLLNWLFDVLADGDGEWVMSRLKVEPVTVWAAH